MSQKQRKTKAPMNSPPKELPRKRSGIGTKLGPIIALLGIVVLFGLLDSLFGNGQYLSMRNLLVIVTESSLIAVPALGMTLIIIAGGIDLSVGTAITLCSALLVVALRDGCQFDIPIPFTESVVALSLAPYAWMTTPVALTLAVLAGLLCGFANGLIVSWFKIVPFVVTLGTMTAFLGIGLILAEETTVEVKRENVPSWIYNLSSTRPAIETCAICDGSGNDPAATAGECPKCNGAGLVKEPDGEVQCWICKGSGTTITKCTNCRGNGETPVYTHFGFIPRFPLGVWLALVLAAAVGVLLHLTVFGRHVFAIGSSEATARLCGLNITKTKIMVYTIAGFFVAVGGIYNYSYIHLSNPGDGLGIELKVIAAVVLGGGSLSGGRGSVIGTLAGALIMESIYSGCVQLSLGDPMQKIILGMIIIGAVILDKQREKS